MIESISQINREVSKQLNISESVIKSINAFYWKKLKQSISSCDNMSVRVNCLGTYIISRTKLWNAIRKNIAEIRYFRSADKEFVRKTKEEYLVDSLNKLSLLLKRRNDIAILYRENELKAKVKRNAKRDLEE